MLDETEPIRRERLAEINLEPGSREALEEKYGQVMGIHRNVIHPKFGNFILLGTILVESEVTEYGQPIDYNPCLECKLCVAACPVGAISPDGDFNFSACYTHNYREFMGGFTDWTEQVADSLRPSTLDGFFAGAPLTFQPGKSAGLKATYHFTFTGDEQRTATIVVRDQQITVEDGHVGTPDLHVTADAATWIGFLRQERNIVWALVRRKVRLRGPLNLLVAFGKCFPA